MYPDYLYLRPNNQEEWSPILGDAKLELQFTHCHHKSNIHWNVYSHTAERKTIAKDRENKTETKVNKQRRCWLTKTIDVHNKAESHNTQNP